MDSIEDALRRKGKFVRRYRKENKEELVEVFNFPPSTIVLDKNEYEIKIISEYMVSRLYVQSRLEEITGIKLEEIK